jgi:hypothetical protein
MPEIPDSDQLKEFRQARMDSKAEGEGESTAAMLAELQEIQGSVDNRAEAVVKVGAFLGTGLAVLANLDEHASVGFSIAVVVLSGVSLIGALMAQNPPVYYATVLAAPNFDDLKRSCNQLRSNQDWLGLATILVVLATITAILVVIFSLGQG